MRICCANFHSLLWSILQLLGSMFILPAKGGGLQLGGSVASTECFMAWSAKGVAVVSIFARPSRVLLHVCVVCLTCS